MSEKRLQMLNSSRGCRGHPCLQNMPPLSLKDRVAEMERKDEPRQEVGKFSAGAFLSIHGDCVICRSSEHKVITDEPSASEVNGQRGEISRTTCEAALLCHLNQDYIQRSFTGYSNARRIQLRLRMKIFNKDASESWLQPGHLWIHSFGFKTNFGQR